MRIVKKIFGDNYVAHQLRIHTAGCRNLLDVGCGACSAVASLPLRKVGIDVYAPSIENAKTHNTHDEYAIMNALGILAKFGPHSFDVVLCNDVIEHFTKLEGYELLRQMEKVAAWKVLLFCPNGYRSQGTVEGNPFQTHKCGWTPTEFRELGYTVYGLNGWKLIGQVIHQTGNRWLRKVMTELIDATTYFLLGHPEKAYQMMAVKHVGE